MMSDSVGQTILVASASDADRRQVSSILQAAGYQVVVAASGADVFRSMRGRKPDVALIHATFADISGMDVCRALKGDARYPLSVVLMRSSAETGDGKRLAFAGADDVVTLPPDPDELMMRVRNALERVRLMRLVQEDGRRIKELEHAREELTQLIVHDMKAPLTGLADLLEMADRASVRHFKAEASQYVNEALDATETLEEMVAFLLDVRHMLAGEKKVKRHRCDLTGIVRGAAELLGESAQATGVSVEVSGEPVLLACDAGLIGRALHHLLRAAILACPKGRGVRAEVSGDAAGGRVAIFCDGGVGGVTPVSDLAEMLRPEGASALSGLGATFCRLVAEAHGGKFGVDNHRGGVSWWLTLSSGEESSESGEVDADASDVPTDRLPQRSRRYLGGFGDARETVSRPRSLLSRTTRSQFAVAVAIMSAIPLLAFGYLLVNHLLTDAVNDETLLLMMPAVVALVVLGIVLLLRHTIEIGRLRQYLELMARGGVTRGEGRWSSSADFAAMGKALDSVIERSSEKVRILEAQSKALLQSEQQRVMVETVGAACHHLGQPATVIGVYLDLMKKKESSPEIQRLIEECQLAASDVSGILHRLQSVAQYQTEPYLTSGRDDGQRIKERILKI